MLLDLTSLRRWCFPRAPLTALKNKLMNLNVVLKLVVVVVVPVAKAPQSRLPSSKPELILRRWLVNHQYWRISRLCH